MSLGPLIRARREALGLTQDQTADVAGISKPYLSNIETGRAKNPPSSRVLDGLESALGLPTGQLRRAAQLERTPAEVRQEHEHLEAQLQKYRSVLKTLLEKANAEPDDDIETLIDTLETDSNVDLLGVSRPVPVINKVAAGYPQQFTDLDYPASIAEEYIRCPDLADPQAFAARIVGDSMEPEFCEGDIVVFSPNTEPRDGVDCFVRFDDGETTFKRVYQDDPETVRLQPLNNAYPAALVSAQRVTGLWPAVARFQRLR
jgi:repressor LexA